MCVQQPVVLGLPSTTRSSLHVSGVEVYHLQVCVVPHRLRGTVVGSSLRELSTVLFRHQNREKPWPYSSASQSSALKKAIRTALQSCRATASDDFSNKCRFTGEGHLPVPGRLWKVGDSFGSLGQVSQEHRDGGIVNCCVPGRRPLERSSARLPDTVEEVILQLQGHLMPSLSRHQVQDPENPIPLN